MQESNQNICVALGGNGKTFWGAIQTAGGSCMSMFSHTWKRQNACQVSAPIDVNAGCGAWLDGFHMIHHAPWACCVKAIRHVGRYGRKEPHGLTLAADSVLKRMLGLLYVCLCAINSDCWSPALYWIQPHVIANTCTGEGEGVGVSKSARLRLMEVKGGRRLGARNLFCVTS